jgi:beta-galactosidase
MCAPTDVLVKLICMRLPLLMTLALSLPTAVSPVQGASLLEPSGQSLADGWRFHLGDAPGAEEAGFSTAGWEEVTLPHPARLEARVTNPADLQQWEGVCWYRKRLELPASAIGQTVWVRFEGAMNRACLYANGKLIGENTDGYLPLVGDLTAFARTPGPIELAVRLENASSPLTGPKPLEQLDFHLYHGLYRTAHLFIKGPLHITDEIMENKPASGGVFVTFHEVSAASATVDTRVHLRNRAGSPASFTLQVRLTDLEGREIKREVRAGLSLPANTEDAFQIPLVVDQPELWSPRSPALHLLEVSVLGPDGEVIDTRSERIGIRKVAFRPGALLINDEPWFLRGVNRHQEYPYVGNAVPANAQYRDAFLIKSAGFDYVRLSHYPQSPDFMAACDELGLVTLPAILAWQYNPGTEAFYANRIQAARELIRRDRNHACALFWEVSLNETKMAAEFVQRLVNAAKEEYPGDQLYTAGWVDGYDIKLTARQHKSTEEFAKATFPALVSEYGDWEYYALNAGLNQGAWKDLKGPDRNSRQTRADGKVRLLQQATNFQEAHNENLGTSAFGDGLWVMFDYNRGYSADLETSGVADSFRVPKYSYYFYQSQRDASDVLTTASGEKIGGPMVHIATAWTIESPLAVRVFSNAEEVELFRDGKSMGRQKPARGSMAEHLRHPPFVFDLAPFTPGELRAVAYIGGKLVAEHHVRTPGKGIALRLRVSIDGRAPSRDGDLLFIHAEEVDANGTIVPGSARSVTFSAHGPGEIVGDRAVESTGGIASALLRTGRSAGSIVLRAEAPGLTAAETTLDLR